MIPELIKSCRWGISLPALCLLLCLGSPLVSGGQQGPDAPGEPAADERSLYLRTLAQDIRTADYYELLAWCRRLGLDDTGGRAELHSRLYRYYDVWPGIGAAEKPSRRIVIESAGRTEYFTIEAVDEDYIVLEGDVIIELIDEEEDVVHRVRAGRVTINQTKNQMSAEGNIEYTIRRGEQPPEVFRSTRFVFNMENWGGVFVEGRGQTEREVEPGEWVTFYYSGENISRLENDTVILEQGELTSSENTEDPYWHIRASKIYVLAPGEWAIQDAVLHIGRVPILYVPFFFKPGDELFFHPALGYRTREGNFIQTTTYLIGRKKQKGSTLSFMRVNEAETEEYEQEIRGLYLRTKETKRSTPKLEAEQAERVLKIMVDYYSRLGFFAGLLSDFGEPWRMKGGVGVSRTLAETGPGVYSQFLGDELEVKWNRSYLGSLTLPFRYGLETDFLIGGGNRSVSGQFGFFSDPFFASDFYSREEDIDWSKVFFGDQAAREGRLQEASSEWSMIPETRDNLEWLVNTDLTFTFPSELLKELRIPKLDLEFYWKSKSTEPGSLPYYQYDPARKFYYPSRLVAPNAELRLVGDFLTLAGEQEGAAGGDGARREEPGKGFKLPSEAQARTVEVAPSGSPELAVPGPREDLSFTPPRTEGTQFALSYDLNPKLLVENQFDTSSLTAARDVDFAVRYTTLNLSGAHTFIADLDLWGETLNLRDELGFEGTYQDHFNRSDGVDEAEWDAISLQDYEKTGFDLNNTLLMTWHPLLYYRFLEKSSLSYELSWDFYSYDFDRLEQDRAVYSGRTARWERDAVDKHRVGSTLVYDPLGVENFLDLSAAIPPLYQAYEGEADFTVGYLNSNVKTAYREEQDGWDPLLITETLDVAPWVIFREKVDYDLNEQSLTSAESVLKLFKLRPVDGYYTLEQELLFEPGERALARSKSQLYLYGFRTYYLAEKMVPVEVDLAVGEWDPVGTTEYLLPSEMFVGYRSLPVPLYMWKNRIRLDTDLSAGWTIDLYRYTDSVMEFSLALNLSVYEFLDLSFRVTSFNTASYRYIPAFADALDEPWVNPLTDLFRSFNFFNIEDRYASSFNLKSVGLVAVHHLGDWDLSFEYAGEQVLKTQPDGSEEYEWSPVFSIVLQWKPIPEIRKEVGTDPDTQEINWRGTTQQTE